MTAYPDGFSVRRAAAAALWAVTAFGAAPAFAQQTYSLSASTFPTVWNYNTTNWVNAAGEIQGWPGGYNSRPNAIITGTRTVDMTGTQFCTTLTLDPGVTLMSSLGQELYASEISGSGTIKNPLVGETSISISNGLKVAGPISSPSISIPVSGATLQGPLGTMTAGTFQIGTVASTTVFNSSAGATVNTTGDMVIGPTSGATCYVGMTGTTLNIGGHFKISQNSSQTTLQMSGGSLNLGKTLSLSESGTSGFTPGSVVTLGGVNIVVADAEGRAGISGKFFGASAGDKLDLGGSAVRVRGGGFLTVSLDRFVVNNTTFDTTGGNALLAGRFAFGSGRLIKAGPGILKITAANEYGPSTSAFDIRGGFLEFTSRSNFGPADAPEVGIGSPSKNIILNGGGLRWESGSTTDISIRLQTLTAPSFDTNGSNVTFGTPLTWTGGLTKVGAGNLSLAPQGASFAGGTTQINGGSIGFPSLSSFGTGQITLNGGGLRWNANTLDISPRLTALGAGGGVFDTNGNNVNLAASPITGPGGITKIGAGTLTITGSHPFSGSAIVEGGTLALNGTFTGKASIRVGSNAAGTLNLNGNAGSATTLSTPANALLGENPTGVGTATVNGFGANLTTGTFIEVGSRGNGTLNITGGGRVTSTTTTALGVFLGASGTLNVTGIGQGAISAVGSSLNVGTTLFVGYGAPAIFTVSSGGSVTAGNVSLGTTAGGSGAFVINPGGTLNVGGANGISSGAGESGFYLSGGTLKVTGSSLTTTVPMVLANSSLLDTSGVDAVLGGVVSGTGGLVKIGGGILYLNAANTYAGGTQLYAGNIVVPAANTLGTGTVAVLGGSLYSSSTFQRDGAVTVSGAGATLSAANYIEIGVGGTGSLAVTSGGQVSSPSSLAFGLLGGGTLGTASVSGTGSSLTSAGPMYLGFLSSGSISVGAGGTVTCGGQMILGSGPAAGGTFGLNPGGTLNVGGTNGLTKGSGGATFFLAGGTLKVTGSTLTTTVPMMLDNLSLIDTSGVDCVLGGALSGAGGLAKNGAGILTLSGSNNYSGSTIVYAGVVRASTVSSLGGGPLALAGGTLDLPFAGTVSVQSLSFDGALQFGGTWGSLASSATNKTARITSSGILNVLGNIQPIAFNAAATTGLSTASGGALINLATATGATPPGGSFSGPGVSGGFFDPAAAGFGLHVITYTANGVSGTFTIGVTGGLALDEEGGAFVPGNLAPGGTAFAFDVVSGFPSHTIAHLNDATYGNSFSWIGNSADSFVGVSLGAAPVTVNRIAFGRDNTGTFTDRSVDFYTVQYTTDPNPTAATTAWTSLGAVDYRPGGNANVANPARRHVFNFAPVAATGLRIRTAAFGTAIDEIEIYPASGVFSTGGLALLQQGGGFAPANLARGASALAFAKDVIPAAPHAIANLNNGSYGNASSWIGNTFGSFAGINLGGSFSIDRLAFGRDNTSGGFTDRTLGRYTIQYTAVANPDATTPDASWTTIGFLDYQTAAGPNFTAPWLRHLFGFPAVTATGLRIIAPASGVITAAIDEIEIYQGQPQLTLEQPVGTPVANGGSVDFGGVLPGQSISRLFTLTNTGTSTLTLFTLSSGGGNAAEFVPAALGNDTLPPGVSTTYQIGFSPAAPGARTSTVTLGSNDPATPQFNYGVTGTGQVPTFNAAATAGLSYPLGNGPVNLSSASAPAPSGGMFSGPAVTNGSFDPTAAGLGVSTIIYTVSGVSSTFTVGVTGGLTLEEEGGSFAPNNLAPAGTAFAKDVFIGNPNHTIPHLNDALYGNGNSWINASANSFAGVSLGATPVLVNRIAFGRDNTAFFGDRCVDFYTLQVTTDPNPTAATTAWTTIGAVDYRAGGGANVATPALRHVFAFAPVSATGVRILTLANGTALDEIEIYPAAGVFTTGSLTLLQESGTFAPANLATATGAVAFAKDLLPGNSNHTIAHLNDATYGNAFSWIGNSAPTFAGINLGGSKTVDRLAFGRDNTGGLVDRALSRYTVQFTTAANPDASTPDASWMTIGFLDYQTAFGTNFTAPSRRHLYRFPAVTATGLRIITSVFGTAIDEIELYEGKSLIAVQNAIGAPLISGGSSVDFGNVGPATSTTRSFSVANQGSASLTLGGATIDGASASDFSPGSPVTPVLAPGASTTFSVTFAPSATGSRTAGLHVPSDDPATPSFDVTLTGNGLTVLGAWRQQFFGNFLNAGSAADTADPNGNGVPNLVEYALHGNPAATAGSLNFLPQLSRNGNRLQLSFQRYFDRPDITLTVQGLDVLTNTWTDLAQSVGGTPFTVLTSGAIINEVVGATSSAVSVQDIYLITDPAHPQRFLRLRVTNP